MGKGTEDLLPCADLQTFRERSRKLLPSSSCREEGSPRGLPDTGEDLLQALKHCPFSPTKLKVSGHSKGKDLQLAPTPERIFFW